MRRQSLIMLVGAALLAVVAVFLARLAFGSHGPAQASGVAVVVAAKPLAFSDKVTADTLSLIQLPPNAVPAGAFHTLETAIGDGTRVAQRAIAVNEVVVPTAISGTGNRLSTMGVIGDSMRAMTVNVTESSGVGGLVAPGDHVDVYITRTPPEKAPRYDVVAPPPGPAPGPVAGSGGAGGPHTIAPAYSAPQLVRTTEPEGVKPTPITDLLIQDVRVLAIGQNINVSSEKPELVKSATLEVTPAQVAKLTLGQSVGSLALALRPLSDTDHTTVPSLHVEDLHDGAVHTVAAVITPHRHVPRHRAPAHHAPAAPAEPQIEVVRAGTATNYTVPTP